MKALEAILDDGERVTMQPTIICDINFGLKACEKKKSY
jgi:hypothetical protein